MLSLRSKLLYCLLVLLCNIGSYSSEHDIYSCPRIRKAWHLTTEQEKQLFIKGIHQLNDEGKFKQFGTTHQHLIDSNQAHNTAAFFAWHRYFLWEFENQIRRLAPQYQCFSIPYWDITTESGLLHNAYIFQSGLGGIGGINNECVDNTSDGAWSVTNYPLQHIIDTTDNPSNAYCLKRAGGWMDVSAVSSYTHSIISNKEYGTTDGFRQTVSTGYHSEIHSFIGGIWNNYTHMTSRYSAEDPLFYLTHTWFDYIFVIWKQCWGYNKIDPMDLDTHLDAYSPWSHGLDDVLYYIPMDDVYWWEGNVRNPTVRSTWDEIPWNIQYERGTFVARSHLSTLCDNIWDTDVLLENSIETERIIEDKESEVDEYQQRTWNYIHDMMQDEESDYIQTWNAMTCNYQRQRMGKEPCYIPQEYEKCTEDDYERRDEIRIDELLNKEGVKGNDCLEDVRINTYSWCKSMDMLYELCIGELDRYFVCDVLMVESMMDYDNVEYYEKLMLNKERMKREALIIDNKRNIREMDTEEESAMVGEIGKYTRFDVFGCLVVAFVIGGCAFVALMIHCAAECNVKFRLHQTDDSQYGSTIEML